MKKIKEFEPDFLNIPYVVMHMQPADRFTFGAIYMFSNLSQKRCTASNIAIGKIAKISPESVSNSLNHLEEEGFIKRHFKDNNKRTRDWIECLVGFVKIPCRNGIDTISRLDKIPSTDEQIKNIDIDTTNVVQSTVKPPEKKEEYNPESYLDYKMNTGKPHEKVVALYIKYKKLYLKCSDIKGLQTMMYDPVHLKFGKMIMGFKPGEVINAMKKLDATMINGEKMTWGITHLKNALNR